MNIGIIGSGDMGTGLGKIWSEKGHSVMYSFSHSPEKLKSLAASHPNAQSGTPEQAAAHGDVILLSVGWKSIHEAITAAGSLKGKIVIDCTNPLKPDASDLEVGLTTSGGEEIARLLPESRIVKTFNTVYAEIYHSDSRLFGSRMPTMFYCGDDSEAKIVVSKLIIETGFEPVDTGPLKSSRYLEPLAMLMIRLGIVQGMGTDITLSLIRR
jgi:8-hydroxy-5-deazaflavin:NADPH oxidoreductase